MSAASNWNARKRLCNDMKPEWGDIFFFFLRFKNNSLTAEQLGSSSCIKYGVRRQRRCVYLFHSTLIYTG